MKSNSYNGPLPNDMEPITLEQLTSKAYDIHTAPDYSAYLQDVLIKAKDVAGRHGSNIEKIEFTIDTDNGEVHPFGELTHYAINKHTAYEY